MNEPMVTVSLERYEQLIDLEARVDVLIDRIRNEEMLMLRDMFLTLGLTKDYRELKEREYEELKKYAEELGNVSED